MKAWFATSKTVIDIYHKKKIVKKLTQIAERLRILGNKEILEIRNF